MGRRKGNKVFGIEAVVWRSVTLAAKSGFAQYTMTTHAMPIKIPVLFVDAQSVRVRRRKYEML